VDKADAKYFNEFVEPLLADANVEFIGEIDDAQKPAFLSGAAPCCSRSTGRSRSGW